MSARPPAMTLAGLLEMHGGRLIPDDRRPDSVEVTGVAPITERRAHGRVAVLSDPRLTREAEAFDGAAVLTERPLDGAVATQWIHEAPDRVFDSLCRRFAGWPIELAERYTGRSASARIHPDADVDESVSVAPGAVVAAGAVVGGDSVIGPNAIVETGARVGIGCTIGAGAVLVSGAQLGRGVHVGPNAVIGSAGFGYRVEPEGHRVRRPHVGGVVIGDDVHIGAGTCIDAGTLEPTRVGPGCRIDNLVHLAHNVVLGARCVVLAQVGIAGSTRVGDDVILAGQVGVAGHLEIGDRARVAAKGGVGSNLAADAVVAGAPAYDLRRWRRTVVMERELPERLRTITQLTRRVAALEQRLAETPTRQDDGADL